MNTRKCKTCKKVKNLSCFYYDRCHKRYYSNCKRCRNKKRKTKWDKVQNASYLKRTYGITIDDYNKMFAEQQGCCAICDKHQSELSRQLSVDHNHITGEVRGLLCGNCNSGIGMLGVDNGLHLIKKVIDYAS